MNAWITSLAALLTGTTLGAIGTWFFRRVSTATGFLDHPGGHKGHARPVALGGGVAVTTAIIVPVLVGLLATRLYVREPPGWMPGFLAMHLDGILSKWSEALSVCGAAAALCILGLVDDRRPLGIWIKLIVQLAIAGWLVLGCDLRLLSLLPASLSVSLSILWIVILTNAINFLDNMDGLAAGVAAIAAGIFGIAAMFAGQVFVPACCWLLAGALLGFLPFNLHPATIYLGDAGSTVVGLLLAVFTILTTFTHPAEGQQPLGVIAPLVVMAVPLYDTASVFYLRWRGGVPIWTADRRHFSHRLVRRGFSTPLAVTVIWMATLVTALPALLLPGASWQSTAVIVAQTVLVVALVALLESTGAHGKAS